MVMVGGLAMVVYLDVFFLVNFLMDYLLLWATGELALLSHRRWRMVLGALAGALYSLSLFLPQVTWA